MNPSSKGWLVTFINDYFIKDNLLDILFDKNKAVKNDQFLYRLIQATGLIYGYPANFFHTIHPEINHWNNKERLKLILLECFLNYSLYLTRDKLDRTDPYFRKEIDDLIGKINLFYASTDVTDSTKLKGKDEYERLEHILDKRIGIRKNVKDSFWISLFQNSLIFLDLVFYSTWLEEKKACKHFEVEELKVLIVKTIIAAAYSNNSVEKEEKYLFNYYLKSAQLSTEKEKEVKQLFQEGLSIDDIELDRLNNWVLRKYCLEVACLTVWADKLATEKEKVFLYDLGERLKFSEDEIDDSILAVESFIFANAGEIHYLKGKQSYNVVSKSISHRLSKMIKKNKTMIIREMHESKELVELLAKSHKQKLSEDEKAKVRDQTLDILKTIPSFAIFMLPGGSVILPVLLKILPEEILIPSSFRNKKRK